ncbi:MAG: PKD domain-containing protein [Thermoplasmatota archaeon]
MSRRKDMSNMAFVLLILLPAVALLLFSFASGVHSFHSRQTRAGDDLRLSDGCHIPPVVYVGEPTSVVIEVSNPDAADTSFAEVSVFIETSGGEFEFSVGENVIPKHLDRSVVTWYPSETGNYRGWINLTINGTYIDGLSYNIRAVEVLFYEDCEGGIDHWTVDGEPEGSTWWVMGPDEWDNTTTISRNRVYFAGALDGSPEGGPGFNGSTLVSLESDWIDLTYYTDASLHLYHSYDFQGSVGSSGGVVQAFSEETGWEVAHSLDTIYGKLGDNITGGFNGQDAFVGTSRWTHAEFDLSSFIGSRTRLRFTLASSESGRGAGWFLDDISVSGRGYDPYDTQPPARIEGLDVEVIDEGAVSISWYPSLAQDFAVYNIYLEEFSFSDTEGLTPYETLGSIDTSSIILTDLDPNSVFWVGAAAQDIVGNEDMEVLTLSFQPTKRDLNSPPVAKITVVGGYYTRTVMEDVTFDGSGSYDPDGDPISYIWTMPDGSTHRGPEVTWRSGDKGKGLEIRLTVRDTSGSTGSDSVTLDFVDDGNGVTSNQGLTSFLLFIAPVVLFVLILILIILFVGRGRKRKLETRLRKIGVMVDEEGRVHSVPTDGRHGGFPSEGARPKVHDLVQVSGSGPNEPSREDETSSKSAAEEKSTSRVKKAPPIPGTGEQMLKVVLECPYCGESFKEQVKGSVIRNNRPFTVTCPHCGESGDITA